MLTAVFTPFFRRILLRALLVGAVVFGVISATPRFASASEGVGPGLWLLDEVDDLLLSQRIGDPQIESVLKTSRRGVWIAELSGFLSVSTDTEFSHRLNPETLKIEEVDHYQVRTFVRTAPAIWAPIFPFLSVEARAGITASRLYTWSEVRTVPKTPTFPHPFFIVPAIRKLETLLNDPARTEGEVTVEDNLEFSKDLSVNAGAKVSSLLGAAVMEEGEHHRFRIRGRSLGWSPERIVYRREKASGTAISRGTELAAVVGHFFARAWIQTNIGIAGNFGIVRTEKVREVDDEVRCEIRSLTRSSADCSDSGKTSPDGSWKDHRWGSVVQLFTSESEIEEGEDGSKVRVDSRRNGLVVERLRIATRANADGSATIQAEVDAKKLEARWLRPLGIDARESTAGDCLLDFPNARRAPLLAEFTLPAGKNEVFSRKRPPTLAKLRTVLSELLRTETPMRLTYLDRSESGCPRLRQGVAHAFDLKSDRIALEHFGDAQFYSDTLNTQEKW